MEISNNTDSLYEVLNTVNDVFRTNGQFVLAYVGGWAYFSEDVVQEVDRDLAPLLGLIIDNCKFARGEILRWTLNHWWHPGKPAYTDFPSRDQKYSTRPHYVYPGDPDDGPDLYRLGFDMYSVDCSVLPQGVVTTITRNINQVVPKSWLDQHYPGLTEKIKMLSAITADYTEISELALQDVVETTVPDELAKVQFDQP